MVGSIARRIGRTEKRDSGRAKSDRKVQGTGVTADNAHRVAQQSHQRAELAVVQQRISIATSGAHRGCQVVFPGTVVYDAAQAQSVAQLHAKRTKSLSRPALRAPTTPRTQDNIATNARILQLRAHPQLRRFGGMRRENGAANLRAPARCESSPFWSAM